MIAEAFSLAARQIALDRAATARYPRLFAEKKARLSLSPHTFFRGSAPLFYEILAARPELCLDLPGSGLIVGDMHLENVGAYRTDLDRVIFNVNDFDDATFGPRYLDVLRLSTSVLLAGRSFKCTGSQAISLVEALIDAYGRGLAGGPEAPQVTLGVATAKGSPVPAPIAEMMVKADGRSRRALLDGRAPEGRDGRRRFTRGDRYFDLPAEMAAAIPRLVATYMASLGDRAPAGAAKLTIEDAALRVAGTGSLGVSRIAVLLRDPDGEERIIELKEAKASATEALFPAPPGRFATPADRVVAAAHALSGEPPRRLARVDTGDLSFAARRLFPQEDKLEVEDLHMGPKLDAVVAMIGHVLGAAHARAAEPPLTARWPADGVGKIVDRAVALAGIFEATYLAYARIS